jgi:hypothetical protein
MMTGFTPQMDDELIICFGVIQGLGLGLVFVPLSTVAFATLPPYHRTDAASLFSLVRNIGSSIGISIVTVALTHNLQVNHAELSTRSRRSIRRSSARSPAARRAIRRRSPARPAGQPAGADDRLYRRFQADDAGHAGRDPAGAVPAQAAGRAGRHAGGGACRLTAKPQS